MEKFQHNIQNNFWWPILSKSKESPYELRKPSWEYAVKTWTYKGFSTTRPPLGEKILFSIQSSAAGDEPLLEKRAALWPSSFRDLVENPYIFCTLNHVNQEIKVPRIARPFCLRCPSSTAQSNFTNIPLNEAGGGVRGGECGGGEWKHYDLGIGTFKEGKAREGTQNITTQKGENIVLYTWVYETKKENKEGFITRVLPWLPQHQWLIPACH